MAKRQATNFDDLLGDEDDIFTKAAVKKVEAKSEPKREAEVKTESEVKVVPEVKVEPAKVSEPVKELAAEKVTPEVIKDDVKAAGEKNTVEENKEVVKPVVKVEPKSEMQPVVKTQSQIEVKESSDDNSESSNSEDLNLVPHVVKSVPESGYNSLKDIQDLIIQGLTVNDSTKAVNIYMSEQTTLRMEKIQKALKANSSVGTKAKLPLIQKILVDFFWDHFGQDVIKRVEKAEKELTKRLL